MPKAVIFDVDGTLIDSNDLHTECWIETFEHFGLDFAYDQVRRQIGKGGDQLLPTLLPASVWEQQGEAISDFAMTYSSATTFRVSNPSRASSPCSSASGPMAL